MEKKIKKEIEKRLAILKKQGMQTDLDLLEIITTDGGCISSAENVMGYTVGILDTVTVDSHIHEIWDKAVSKISLLGATAYLGMYMNTTMGELLTVLYISDSESEWKLQREELKRKNTCALVYNVSEKYSEFGYIEYDMYNGGPIRIG